MDALAPSCCMARPVLARRRWCAAWLTRSGIHGVQVLWGSGQLWDAADALFLPITMALSGWLREADPADRDRVLDGLAGVGALLPAMAANAHGRW